MDDILDLIEAYLDDINVRDYEVNYATDDELKISANLDERYHRDLAEYIYDNFPDVSEAFVVEPNGGPWEAEIEVRA